MIQARRLVKAFLISTLCFSLGGVNAKVRLGRTGVDEWRASMSGKMQGLDAMAGQPQAHYNFARKLQQELRDFAKHHTAGAQRDRFMKWSKKVGAVISKHKGKFDPAKVPSKKPTPTRHSVTATALPKDLRGMRSLDGYVSQIIKRAQHISKDGVFEKLGYNSVAPNDFWVSAQQSFDENTLRQMVGSHGQLSAQYAQLADKWMAGLSKDKDYGRLQTLLGKEDLAQKIYDEFSYWLLFDTVANDGRRTIQDRINSANNLFSLSFQNVMRTQTGDKLVKIAQGIDGAVGRDNYQRLDEQVRRQIAAQDPDFNVDRLAQMLVTGTGPFDTPVDPAQVPQVKKLATDFIRLRQEFAYINSELSGYQHKLSTQGYENIPGVERPESTARSPEQEDPTEPTFQQQKKTSLWKKMIRGLLVAALLGGAAYTAWQIKKEKGEKGGTWSEATKEVIDRGWQSGKEKMTWDNIKNSPLMMFEQMRSAVTGARNYVWSGKATEETAAGVPAETGNVPEELETGETEQVKVPRPPAEVDSLKKTG